MKLTVQMLERAFKESGSTEYLEVEYPSPKQWTEFKGSACGTFDGTWNLDDVVRRINEFTALDRLEVKGDEHERDTTGSGTTTEG